MPNQLIRRKKAKRQGPMREAGDVSLVTRSRRTAVPDGEFARHVPELGARCHNN
jgi:hypothetical protein